MESITKVNLPMDFGIEYLDSLAHENLRFLCQGDEELLANSVNHVLQQSSYKENDYRYR